MLLNNLVVVILLFILGLTPAMVKAQPTHWEQVDFGSHTPWIPRFLHYSDNLGVTIYGGYFFYDEEEQDPYLAGYNGENWVVISDTISGSYNNVVDYGTGFLISGGIGYLGTQNINGIAYFDGEEWSYPWSFNESISKLVWANDTLYAVGWFTEINETEAYRVARLVNNQWEGVISPNVFLNSSSINDLQYYNGEIYIGGDFETTTGVKRFARIVGDGLEEVAGGLPGANTAIRDMEVYNGELYLAGIIPEFQGNVGNHIVRYNGVSIEPVGEPLGRVPYVSEIIGNVAKIFQHEEFLYAHGFFDYAGDVPMHGIARWDGEEWCGIFSNEFLQENPPTNNTIQCAGTFQDKIMVYVPYFNEDNEQIPLWIYEGGDEVEFCTETVSVNNIPKPQITFELYPNPAQSQITIQCDEQIMRLEVMDVSGRVVQAWGALPKNGILDIGGFPAGIYLVRIETDGGFGVRKMVVE